MNITKEISGELTAKVKIQLTPADYQPKVETTLKNYQKKANMPGFRAGKVPFGVVKKMYGKAAMAEEINKLLNDSIYNYIQDNKLDVLGSPLPSREHNEKFDFENPTDDFEFSFDIGLAPEIKLNLSDKIKATAYKIKVDEDTVNKYIEDIRQRFGQLVNPEVAGEKDLIKGIFVELDSNGSIKAGGLLNETTLSIDHIKAKDIKKKLIGSKVDDKLVFNPLKATENEIETAYLLGIKKEEAAKINGDFQFTVQQIQRMEPADLNEDLFKKVYAKDNITSEAELRNRIKQDAEQAFAQETDRKLSTDMIKALIQENSMKLPDAFLKRFLLETNEKGATAEQIEQEFDKFQDSVKWQLIENKIIRENGITVEEEEVKNYFKDYFRKQFEQFASGEELSTIEEKLESIATQAMSNREEVKKVYDKLVDDKLLNHIKSKIKIAEKEISYEDFVKLVSAN